MRYLQPCAWWNLPQHAVVLIDNIPRAVLDIALTRSLGGVVSITAYVEGVLPLDVTGTYAQPVELDETDAITALFAAGLNPTPIKE